MVWQLKQMPTLSHSFNVALQCCEGNKRIPGGDDCDSGAYITYPFQHLSVPEDFVVALGSQRLLQLFGFDADVFLAGCALFPVFSDPGFPALAGSGIAVREFERGDV